MSGERKSAIPTPRTSAELRHTEVLPLRDARLSNSEQNRCFPVAQSGRRIVPATNGGNVADGAGNKYVIDPALRARISRYSYRAPKCSASCRLNRSTGQPTRSVKGVAGA